MNKSQVASSMINKYAYPHYPTMYSQRFLSRKTMQNSFDDLASLKTHPTLAIHSIGDGEMSFTITGLIDAKADTLYDIKVEAILM